jgi:hypothetical protein
LRHCRFGDEERPSDLGCRQPTEHAQRQRDLRVDRERGVAAGEDEGKPLVGNRAHVVLLLYQLDGGEPLERRPLRLAAQPVDRAVAGGGDDPGAGIRRDAVAGPALRGDRERLLDGVLGEVEVAEPADQDRDRTPELLPEGLLYSSQTTTGRTSIDP